MTSIPLSFDAYQSFFVVFPHGTAGIARPNLATTNFPALEQIAQLDGAWDVAFDPARGGPADVTLDRLQDWTEHPEAGVRYYSGVATYRKRFDLPAADDAVEPVEPSASSAAGAVVAAPAVEIGRASCRERV